MSALGDRIVNEDAIPKSVRSPLTRTASAVEWNGLRQELIDLRAQAADLARLREILPGVHATVVGPSRPCPVCRMVKIGADMVECTSCAGAEDAAAKRSADQ